MNCQPVRHVYLGEGIWWKLSPSAAQAVDRRRCEEERQRRLQECFKPKTIRTLEEALVHAG